MDYGKILARSLQVTWKYRALWLFGILFALFGGSRGGEFGFPGGWSNRGARGVSSAPDLPQFNQQTTFVLVCAAVTVLLIWILLSVILRFVSRGALIGLVRELEARDTTPTLRRGFDIGFDRFKSLFGIGLIVNLPLMLLMLGLVFAALAPMLASLAPLAAARRAPTFSGLAAVGIASSLVLLCCVASFILLAQFVIKPFYEFFTRACVVGGHGAVDSLREGYRVARANLGSVAMLYILTIAINLGYGLLMIPVALMLISIPAGAGFIVYWLANSFAGALAVGAVIAFPMLALLALIVGLYETFESTLWTEAYLALTVKNLEGR